MSIRRIAVVLSTLEDGALHRSLRRLDKLELADVRALTERFFRFSFKTIKARLGRALDTGSSELVLRGGRATTAAAEVLGGFDAARRYLRTKNYALGGAIPLELLKTAEGERLVMNELHAQAEGGPL